MLLGRTQVINVLQGEVDGRDQQIKVRTTEHKCRFALVYDFQYSLEIVHYDLFLEIESQVLILMETDVLGTFFSSERKRVSTALCWYLLSSAWACCF